MANSSTRYDDGRITTICSKELFDAQGFQADEIESNREKALKYYFGKPRGDEVEGLSAVQSLDVADMIEAVISFMAPSLTSQSLVQFVSVGADDEEQAAKESRIVQALVRSGRSNAYVAIQEATKDALLLRNGILKLWVEEKQDITRERFNLAGDDEGPDLATLGQILGQQKPGTAREVASSERAPRGKGPGKSTARLTVWNVTIKQTVTKRQLRMGAVDPCNFYFSADASSMDVNDLRFCAERQFPTRSDLIEEGIASEVVRKLKPYTGDLRMDSAQRRQTKRIEEKGVDFWSQRIEVYRCYPLMGTGEGGRAERWCVSLAGGLGAKTMLSKERVHCVPYGVGAILFAGHQFQGISLFDKLAETQDTKTGFLREWLNNAQLVNKPRAALRDGLVNEDDFYDVRVGGGIKVQAPDAIQWVLVPDIGPSCQAGLAYQDQMRSERGGASLELMKPGAQLNSPTMGGQEREISIKEQLAALFAANLAQTLLRSAYIVAHKLLRYEMGDYVSAQDGGEWLEGKPSKWSERDDVVIVIGLSPGERARRLGALERVIAEQEKLLQAGLGDEITTLGQLHRSLIEWTRASGLDAPEKFWIDPDSDEAKKARQQKQETAARVGKAQAEVLGRVKILEAQVDTYKVQLQEAGKYWAEVIRAEVEEMKVVGGATATLHAATAGGAARSGALMAAADQTTKVAGEMATAEMPEAGQLPPGTMQ